MDMFSGTGFSDWFVLIATLLIIFQLLIVRYEEIVKHRPSFLRFSLGFFIAGIILLCTLTYFMINSQSTSSFQELKEVVFIVLGSVLMTRSFEWYRRSKFLKFGVSKNS